MQNLPCPGASPLKPRHFLTYPLPLGYPAVLGTHHGDHPVDQNTAFTSSDGSLQSAARVQLS